MMLRVGNDRQKRNQRKKHKENQGQTASDRVKEKTTIENITLYDA